MIIWARVDDTYTFGYFTYPWALEQREMFGCTAARSRDDCRARSREFRRERGVYAIKIALARVP